jgi:hypothetical protein
MRDLFLRAMLVGVAVVGWAACGSAGAQMHKVAKPEQVVRAVGVYEWTGDMTKPTASRLIPVSIFIEGKLEDAGVYVARPVPFALLSGNVYELQDAGVDKAMLDLAFARHLQAENATGDLAYDDGWFGYGSVKPLAVAKLKPASKLKPSKTLPVLMSSTGATTQTTDANHPQLGSKTSSDGTAGGGDAQSKTTKPDAGAGAGTTSASTDDPDRPTMKRRSDSSGTTAGGTDTTAGTTSTTPAGGSTPADDPDRPTMKRRSDSTDTTAGGTDTTAGTSSTTASTAGSAPADDPDRPTMKRRTSDSSDGTGDSTTASSTGSGGTPADDPDRPTLKRHSAEDAKKAQNSGSDLATVSGAAGSLNDDPDRPSLHHGKPTSAMTETELPKLVGMPVDLHQMVAVSDAVNRDPHEFTLAFDDATQRAAVLQKMQGMARAQLAAYKGVPAPAAAPARAVAKVTATTPRRTAAPAAAPVALMDEELKAYTLSYGGAATYVYSAHTAGTGSALRYVTIVAQADGLGELKPAIQSVTDAAHLDRAPRMRFVDVVDVEASNRASLLFELRGQNARQFGLYRVIAAHSEQIFLTGTTQ